MICSLPTRRLRLLDLSFVKFLVFIFPLSDGLFLQTLRQPATAESTLQNGDEHRLSQLIFQRHITGALNATTCYKDLGCFPTNYPWTSLMRPLPPPHSPDMITVKLHCYSRDSPWRHNVTLWPDIVSDGLPFKKDRKAVFITHGFLHHGSVQWMIDLKNTYLKAEDAAVCLVCWRKGSEQLNYLQAASNTRIVGAEIAKFVKYLQSEGVVKPQDVHLIGHSLGSHISAYAAKAVPGIGRITALDPAQPAFEGCDKAVRLFKGDAGFVEVIHTNAAPFLPSFGFGLMAPCGDVDIYVNGGTRQPGCKQPKFSGLSSIFDLAKLTVDFIANFISCSHGRAYEYYTQVLEQNCSLWARKAVFVNPLPIPCVGVVGLLDPVVTPCVETCDAESCLLLGLQAPSFTARGVFYAATPTSAPYCDPPETNFKIISEVRQSILRKSGNLRSFADILGGKEIPPLAGHFTAESNFNMSFKVMHW